MYEILLTTHGMVRWLFLLSLIFVTTFTCYAYLRHLKFSVLQKGLLSMTTGIGHIQVIIGIFLYSKSPFVSFKAIFHKSQGNEGLFFTLHHEFLMITAIILITVASAKAKREGLTNPDFFQIFWLNLFALLIVLIAIPWPFSPFVERPYLRLPFD